MRCITLAGARSAVRHRGDMMIVAASSAEIRMQHASIVALRPATCLLNWTIFRRALALIPLASPLNSRTRLNGMSRLPSTTDVIEPPRPVRFVPNRHRVALAHSGNPAFRRPSINSVEFFGTRAISADIVKAGSISSTRAAASCASASRPRWAKADARQR